MLLPFILPYLTHLYNSILTTSEFPAEWKKAKIIPTPKNGNGNSVDYRPIAILPFLSKVFEKAVLRQMHKFLDINNLLNSAQSGFRSNRSCKTVLLYIVDEVRKAIDRKEVSLLTLLDFSKAFDTVDHSILCSKLKNHYRFSSTTTKLFQSYLTGRHQCVIIEENTSSLLPVRCGVPQGSILGPIFFVLYINDLPQTVRYSSIKMFADDVQILISSPLSELSQAISAMNDDLLQIQLWAQQNKLSLNPTKCKTLAIHRTKLDTTQLPDIRLGDTVINYVPTARNLGLVFNETLTWTDHVNATIGKVYAAIRVLWATQHFLSIKTKTLLAKSLLLPILLYGCEVYCNTDCNTKRKLNVIFNNITRYIYNLRRYDHVSQHSVKIFGCSFEKYLQFKASCLIHQVMRTSQPDYLYSKLEFPISQRSYALIQPRYSCLTSERTFFVYTTRQWNSLPIEIRRIENCRTFRISLLRHLSLT